MQSVCARLAFALVLIPGLAAAQSNASDAAMGGYVRDESGAVIPNARVVARHVQTNVETTTQSDENGFYRFPLLRTGEYE